MWILLSALFGCTGPVGPGPSDSGDETGRDDTDPDDEGPERLCQIDVTCAGDILDDPKGPCTIDVTDADGVSLYSGAAGIELRGRSSLAFPKKQYAVELRSYTELPVWPGSSWRYLADGTNPGSAWKDVGFDDSSWTQGAAPLGYGELYLNTEIPAGDGAERPVTTYLRRTFTVYNPQQLVEIDVGLMRNDGAAIYLNGNEIVRDNLPAGAGPTTLASAAAGPIEEITWQIVTLPPDGLVQGENTIAVEVHQAAKDSPDMRFDFFLEAEGAEAPANFFHMGKDAEWILNGQYVDRALFRNRLGFDLFSSFAEENRYATETRFCEMTLNGAYKGIFTLGEKIDRDDDRVNLQDGAAPGDSFIVKLGDGLGFHDNTVGYGSWEAVWPQDDTAEAKMDQFMDQFDAAVKSGNEDAIWNLVDMDSAVDFVLLQEFMKNVDSYQLSVHLYRDVGGKAFFVPWDLDLSMGYPYKDCGATGWNYREFTLYDGTIVKTDYIEAFADSPKFQARLAQRWAELRQDQLSEDHIKALIAGYDETLAPAITRNFETWPIEDIVFKTDFVDNWLCPVSSYDEEHARVLQFVHDRLAWMDANISSF